MMKTPHLSLSGAFSLVEVTFALGICAFCLLAVFGLLPAGFKNSQTASEETAAANLLSLVAVDLRETPQNSGFSSFFSIPVTASSGTTAAVRYFSEAGHSSEAPDADSRYRVAVSLLPSRNVSYTKLATMADVLVSWPAQANPAEAAGRVRTFIAVDRN
ncbi:MAG: hypothetical protein ACFUZC_17950 [Chthoniobacteraceae bacterium]